MASQRMEFRALAIDGPAKGRVLDSPEPRRKWAEEPGMEILPLDALALPATRIQTVVYEFFQHRSLPRPIWTCEGRRSPEAIIRQLFALAEFNGDAWVMGEMEWERQERERRDRERARQMNETLRPPRYYIGLDPAFGPDETVYYREGRDKWDKK